VRFAGFREFPRGTDPGWFNMTDVDAGPVIGGYGITASAFGIGATRAMGRTDHAYKLAAQALVASWPLPDGTLLVPRVLSNVSDAPYLGEAASLFALTRRAILPVRGDLLGGPPAIIYLGIVILLGLGLYEIFAALRKLRRWRRHDPHRQVPAPQVQVILWAILLGGMVVMWLVFSILAALVFLFAALILPWQRKRPAEDPAWAD
jgi:hypothetical protein